MNQKEYRFNPAQELRVLTDESGKRTLSGYAATFNTRSYDLGGFVEQIAPGAFTRSLKGNADVMALSEHNAQKGILGRTKSGTLRLSEDAVGLRFECDLPNTSLGNDVAESVGRGDLDSCSFGFVKQADSWNRDGKEVIRTLKDVDLFDVSVVGNPAYPATSVQLRSLMFPDGSVEIPAEVRDIDTESDSALNTPSETCGCACESCQGGDCTQCTNEDCVDGYCDCGQMRNDKMLAKILEFRLTYK